METNTQENIKKYSRQMVRITNLAVNPENPRFDPVKDQRKAIEQMIIDQDEKLYNLANDIVQDGLNPTKLPLVVPIPNEKNRYIVKEGNRRITAIKILLQPELLKLVPKGSKLSPEKFKALCNLVSKTEFNEIECVISEDKTYVNKWIQIEHTNNDDGTRTEVWDRKQKDRFMQSIGYEKSIPLQIIDISKDKLGLDSETKNLLEEIDFTNLERIISDREFKKYLGINIEKKTVKINEGDIRNVSRLKKVITDLAHKNIKVSRIYKKEDRKEYMSDIEKELFPNDCSSDANQNQQNGQNHNPNQSNPAGASKTGQNPKKGKHQRTKRKSLISCVLQIEQPRINKIYRELRDLDADSFTNASAVLLRVFLELSLDYYFTKNKISGVSKENSELHQKVDVVANYMKDNGIINDKELKPIRALASSPNNYASINTLNAYIHNMDFNPLSDNLKVTWDNIELFIKKLWE